MFSSHTILHKCGALSAIQRCPGPIKGGSWRPFYFFWIFHFAESEGLHVTCWLWKLSFQTIPLSVVTFFKGIFIGLRYAWLRCSLLFCPFELDLGGCWFNSRRSVIIVCSDCHSWCFDSIKWLRTHLSWKSN